MVQQLGRFLWYQMQVNRQGMPVQSSHAGQVVTELIPPLRIRLDDFKDELPREMNAVAAGTLDEFREFGPTGIIELETDLSGIVA